MIYIAGPMTGYPQHNYPAFEAAAGDLRALGFRVVSPHELHDDDMGRPFDWYLRRDLKALVECDAIALLPGWQDSRGASLEHHVAVALGLQVFTIENCRLVRDCPATALVDAAPAPGESVRTAAETALHAVLGQIAKTSGLPGADDNTGLAVLVSALAPLVLTPEPRP